MEQSAQEKAFVNQRARGYRKPQSLESKEVRALELAIKNPDMTASDIARGLKMSDKTVRAMLSRFRHLIADLQHVEAYTAKRRSILDAAQMATLRTATDPKKLQKASTLQAAKAFEIFYKANRLESGQSTDNHAVQSSVRVSISKLEDI